MVAAAVAVGGAAVSLYSSSQASGAARDAAGAQLESSRLAVELGREGLGFQQEMFDVGRADRAPYAATGGAALHAMSNMFLPGGQPMVQLQGRLNDLRAQRATMARQEQGGAAQPDSSNSALSGFTQQVQQNPFLLASRAGYEQIAPSGSPLEAARMEAAARFAQTHPRGGR